jgi:hypothetical protein
METLYLGWSNGAYYISNDVYLEGQCTRCGRNRRECATIIEATGKRCTETKPYPNSL